MARLTWLPDVLTNAGLKISLVPGWEDRGAEVGPILGVLCHHTVGPKTGIMPSLDTLVHGRKARPASPGRPAVAALAGPLAQLGLARDGTFFVIAAGRANHAGAGSFEGVSTGNTNFIGIEGENSGGLDDFPWPDVQMEAYHHGVAAILKHIGRGAKFCGGHKEYAPLRKPVDPRFDMVAFRASVAEIMNNPNASPTQTPDAEPPKTPGGPPGRPTLRRGATGEFVDQIQEKVGVSVDSKFGPKTEAAVRAFQRAHGLVPDGIVGPKTWAALDAP